MLEDPWPLPGLRHSAKGGLGCESPGLLEHIPYTKTKLTENMLRLRIRCRVKESEYFFEKLYPRGQCR
eukprot:7674718-Alexandrium_andersonii.AAC.1